MGMAPGDKLLVEARVTPGDIAFIKVGDRANVKVTAYDFSIYKSGEKAVKGAVRFMADNAEKLASEAAPLAAVAEGVLFTRDLVNEPANVLTTSDFAARLAAMQELGLDVEILEEPELEKLGMRALLGVGQGSESPSKVVVMQWHGGKKGEKPFAFVGKGVVFDTGGISIKPADGMQDMTMDMGGAGVVAGVMRTLALRKAKANVVGLVGLVENMPDGKAQRPGDVVRSMKGDTIEVINTDAEGRLVLADVLWYAQERFKPTGMINLATLTGAIVVALGHENAGVFSNDDKLCAALLKAAGSEGEGAWRMPLSPAYDAILKSHIADMRNSCGRPAGSITAAQFLKRFVKDETPWCHIDIAGVTLQSKDTTLAPKGATGWGVMTLDRLIRDLLDDPEILGTDLMADFGPRQEEAVGVIEAPRGTLFHHYRVGEDDLVKFCNLIVSTTNNNQAMNTAVREVAKQYLHGQEITEGLLNHIEVAIRAFDPCLSCATHALGQMPLEVTLVDAEGTELDRKYKA